MFLVTITRFVLVCILPNIKPYVVVCVLPIVGTYAIHSHQLLPWDHSRAMTEILHQYIKALK